MLPHIELLTIPLTAGVVGYITNAIAIKMLFRPFKPHWYTLWWQGIVPKTRDVLASNIGKIVGSKLVTYEEINKVLIREDIQETLAKYAYDFVAKDISSKNSNLNNIIKNQIIPKLNSVLNDKDISKKIDYALISFFTECLGSKKAFLEVSEAENTKDHLLLDEQIDLPIKLNSAIKEIVHIFIGEKVDYLYASDLLLKDVVTIDKKKLSLEISNIAIYVLIEILENDDLIDYITDEFIKNKNTYFKNSIFGKIKLNLINAFLSKNAIKEILVYIMPSLCKKVRDSNTIRRMIRSAIIKRFEYYNDQKISYLLLQLKITPEDLKVYFNNMLPENLLDPIVDTCKSCFVDKTGNSPLGLFCFTDLIKNLPDEKIQDFIYKIIYPVLGNYNNIKILIKSVSSVISKAIEPFLSIIDISGIVEKKIDSLDLIEVEDLLFSFMKVHFKWINILGFIIGFVLGLFQLFYIFMSGGYVN